MSLDDLARLLRYDDWANTEALRSLCAMQVPPSRGVKLLAHIVNAQWLWLSRLKQDGAQIAVWPDYGLDETERQLPVLRRAWERYLQGRTPSDLERTIEYVNTKGDRYANAVGDVLLHVIMHGVYHRGQVAALAREHGGEPAYTDFVHAMRTGKI